MIRSKACNTLFRPMTRHWVLLSLTCNYSYCVGGKDFLLAINVAQDEILQIKHLLVRIATARTWSQLSAITYKISPIAPSLRKCSLFLVRNKILRSHKFVFFLCCKNLTVRKSLVIISNIVSYEQSKSERTIGNIITNNTDVYVKFCLPKTLQGTLLLI